MTGTCTILYEKFCDCLIIITTNTKFLKVLWSSFLLPQSAYQKYYIYSKKLTGKETNLPNDDYIYFVWVQIIHSSFKVAFRCNCGALYFTAPGPGPGPQFVFNHPGPQFVFTGPGSKFLFTGPGQSRAWACIY